MSLDPVPIVVVPPNEFAPDKITAPAAPAVAKLKEDAPSSIIPPIVRVLVACEAVIVVLDANVTAPAPKFKLFVPVKVKLFMEIAGSGDNVIAEVASIVVPEAMVNVPAEPPLPPKAAAFPIFNVPTLCVTPPVKVFTPDKVNAPAPALVIPPLPEITPVEIAVAFAPSIVNK